MSFGDVYRSKLKKIAHMMMICFAIFAIVSFPVVKSMNGSKIDTDDVAYSGRTIDEIIQQEEFELVEEHMGLDAPSSLESEAELGLSYESEFESELTYEQQLELGTNMGATEFNPSTSRMILDDVYSGEENEETENAPGFFDGVLQFLGIMSAEDEDVPNSVALLRGAEQCAALSSSEFDGSMTVTSGTTVSAINTWLAGLGSGEYLLTFSSNYILTGQLTINGKNLTIQGATGNEVVSRGSTFADIMFNINNGTVVLSNIIFDGYSSLAPVSNPMVYSQGDSALLYIEDCAELRNNNTSNSGGAIRAMGGEVVMDGGYIHDNNSTDSGGGIFSNENASVTINGGTISNNSAMTIYDELVDMSYGGGGGIHAGGMFTMNGGIIEENEVSPNYSKDGRVGNGGGVLAVQAIINDGFIRNNEANTGGGILITANEGGYLSINGGEIYQNVASSITVDDITYLGSGGGISSSQNVTISNGEIYQNSADWGGGGVYSRENAQLLTMSGGEVSDNEAAYGGGIYTSKYSTTTISSDALIYSNEALTSGGGIYSNGDVSIQGGVIGGANDKSNSAQYGGGIFVYNHTQALTISGGEISYNKATNGGGIYSQVNSVTTISNTVLIHSNSATSSGGGVFTNGTIDITGGVIGGASDKANTAAYAGGIFVGEYTQTLTMSGGEISYNVATVSTGGGIYANFNSTTNISGNALIYSNTATGNGGGIYSNGSVNITGGVIGGASDKANTATSGGGIYISINAQSITMSGGEISFNKTTSSAGGGIYADTNTTTTISGLALIHSNTATGNGGGIYSNGSVNITGGVIGGAEGRANSASYGGGVYVNNQTLTMSGGEVSYNSVINSGGGLGIVTGTMNVSGGEIHHNSASYGSGLFGNSTPSVINVSNNASIYSNTATTSGGGIYSNGNVSITDGDIYRNSANWGGGVYISSYIQTLTMSGGEISYNEATYGGGVFGGVDSTVTISNVASINSNSATNSGGGISSNGNVNISGGGIGGANGKGNSAVYGGGVYVNAQTFTMTGGDVSYNTGSGIYINTGIANISSGEIHHNSRTFGGGVYGNTGATLNIRGNVKIYSNEATTNHGGGVYGNTSTTKINISENAEIYSNKAVNGGGVGSLGEVNITGGVIGGANEKANIASSYGGGVYNTISGASGGVLAVSNSEISYNTALYGGGIFTSTNTAATISNNALVYSNTATYGGGVCSDANSTTNIINTASIDSNSAVLRGGGIFAVIDSTITISDDVSVISNVSEGLGGGVQLSGTLNISGGNISNNIANSGVGGISTTVYSTVNMSGGVISNNENRSIGGTEYGGGMDTYGILNLSGGTFTGNTSTIGGNAIYFHTSGTLNLSGNPQIGVDNDDNGIYFTQGKEATVIGNLATTSRINIEEVVTDSDTTVIANKVDNATNLTPVNAFQTEADLFVYVPGLTSDPIVSVLPSTTTYILTDPLYIDLEITGDSNIDITPNFNNTDGVLSSIKQTASFTTNIATGVTLSISIDESTSDLVNLTDENYVVQSTNATTSNPTTLEPNTWGFALTDRTLETNNPNSTSTWSKLPNKIDDTSITLKTTNKANRTEQNNTDIFFGAKVNSSQLAGYYQTTLVYTVVGNL